jgi:hypothetical protein
VPLDPSQKLLGQLDGRDFSSCYERGQFFNRGKREETFICHFVLAGSKFRAVPCKELLENLFLPP